MSFLSITTTPSHYQDTKAKWETWKKQQPGELKIVHLLEGHEAKIFVRMAQTQLDEDDEEWPRKAIDKLINMFYNGENLHGHKRVVLWAKEANMILTHGLHLCKVKNRQTWDDKITHAVCPHVIDYWDLLGNLFTDCYYRFFFRSEAPKVWEERIRQPYEFALKECIFWSFRHCPICLDEVTCRVPKGRARKDNWMIYCLICGHYFHFNCIRKIPDFKACPCCQTLVEDLCQLRHPFFRLYQF
jgi:hypothetical protein